MSNNTNNQIDDKLLTSVFSVDTLLQTSLYNGYLRPANNEGHLRRNMEYNMNKQGLPWFLSEESRRNYYEEQRFLSLLKREKSAEEYIKKGSSQDKKFYRAQLKEIQSQLSEIIEERKAREYE